MQVFLALIAAVTLSTGVNSVKVERGALESRHPSVSYGAEVEFNPVFDLETGFEVEFERCEGKAEADLSVFARFPLAYGVPFAEMSVDPLETRGTLYGVLGVFYEVPVFDRVSLVPLFAVGCREHGYDFHCGCELEVEIADGLFVCPSCLAYLTPDENFLACACVLKYCFK